MVVQMIRSKTIGVLDCFCFIGLVLFFVHFSLHRCSCLISRLSCAVYFLAKPSTSLVLLLLFDCIQYHIIVYMSKRHIVFSIVSLRRSPCRAQRSFRRPREFIMLRCIFGSPHSLSPYGLDRKNVECIAIVFHFCARRMRAGTFLQL